VIEENSFKVRAPCGHKTDDLAITLKDLNTLLSGYNILDKECKSIKGD
jgi:hypothetical protein